MQLHRNCILAQKLKRNHQINIFQTNIKFKDFSSQELNLIKLRMNPAWLLSVKISYHLECLC